MLKLLTGNINYHGDFIHIVNFFQLQRLEEEVRENMRLEMEQRKENAIKRRECNIESKSNLNRIRHSQGITRPWVWSYFIQWPMETYMR